MLCVKFGWNWLSASGKKMKMWKVYVEDNDNVHNNENNDNKQRTKFDQKSSLEPLAQVS